LKEYVCAVLTVDLLDTELVVQKVVQKVVDLVASLGVKLVEPKVV